ncbi:MAG: dTMP kinase [Candidatus Altiarchaeum hamiconexum]|uniref:Probable thymidylate kinase n=1 Tax=Candidatus Altarchaeum hamiconexum TaxID=1803513 RepID=A0A8J7Z074_9ARCH|nr:dTMP kinase [Candidatus Altarchaeum hamiconexum]OIQ05825.1 MAG: dTMP kinase [Candidatus Altarchaeum sp. CG2_30_32_3053]PIN67203.1 MAG: dTMP kinase [Candidatus Altarchaeum sp. CG12_big_fil_rev_8_21_14_0_65_33_22]PIV28136.1 MAG: dTMP kinase [Candidatus Altarchaeum sp. CG03_land_8_20_14_0_80_32_618]NCN69427.1 dTMP kinase [Candidatus Altarchaeum hamiconexum]
MEDTKIVDEYAKRAVEKLKMKKEGNLIVFEGIDGSGKTTQVRMLVEYLQSRGIDVVFTDWASSANIGKYIQTMRKDKIEVVPRTFSLLHAAEFAERLENLILPALSAGKTVVCDRYVYTAIARDSALGVDEDYVKEIYKLAPKEDLLLYFDVPPKMALERLIKRAIKENTAKQTTKKGKKGKVAGTISPAGTIAGTVAGTIAAKIGKLDEKEKASWTDYATMYGYMKDVFKTEKDEEAYYAFVAKVVEKYKTVTGENNAVVIDGKIPADFIKTQIMSVVNKKIFKAE